MLSTLRVTYQLATETSPGERKEVTVGQVLQFDNAIQLLKNWISI